MGRLFFYWVNYGHVVGRSLGEGATEVSTEAPIIRGRQLDDIAIWIRQNRCGGNGNVVVRSFQLLREE